MNISIKPFIKTKQQIENLDKKDNLDFQIISCINSFLKAYAEGSVPDIIFCKSYVQLYNQIAAYNSLKK